MAFGWDDAIMLGLSAFSASGIGKGKTTQGEPGGFAVAPQYSFTEPRLRLASDFISDNLQSMQEGKFPAYYQNAMPTIRGGLNRANQQAFFGQPGQRVGSVQAGMQAGAAMGIGPKSGMANTNKALQRYEQASQQIEEFLQSKGVDITQQSMATMLNASNQMPKGPDYIQYGSTQGTYQPGWGDQLSSIAGSLPYLSGEMSSWFGEGTASNPTNAYSDITDYHDALSATNSKWALENGVGGIPYGGGESFVSRTSAAAPTASMQTSANIIPRPYIAPTPMRSGSLENGAWWQRESGYFPVLSEMESIRKRLWGQT